MQTLCQKAAAELPTEKRQSCRTYALALEDRQKRQPILADFLDVDDVVVQAAQPLNEDTLGIGFVHPADQVARRVSNFVLI